MLPAACFLSFCLGIIAFMGLYRAKHWHVGEGKRLAERKSLIERIGVMNLILVIVGVALLAFTLACIWLFIRYGNIPDTLVTCVFAALGGECGIMGWIKTTKDRNREHKWEMEEKAIEAGAGSDDNLPVG